MIKELPEWFGESPILGLILAGTAAVVLAPTVKNVVRGAAVGTAKGVLSLAEGGVGVASRVKDGWEDIVAEARSQHGAMNMEPGVIGAGAGGALGATLGSSMGGPVGAAVGGGVGGVVGAGLSSNTDKKGSKAETKAENKEENKGL